MAAHNEVPTMAALANLVARCKELHRYDTQLTAAEETRIAALADALVNMRHVLRLETIDRGSIPSHHRRVEHWSLVGPTTESAQTPAVRAIRGLLVLDDHGQVKILSDRGWRGAWRTVSLWRDGVHDLSAADLLEFLAHLVSLANDRTPAAADSLVERRQSLARAESLGHRGPRGPGS